MNRIAKRILETVLGVATLTMPIKAQNIVNVHVQSVPSMNNTRARIKATDQLGNSYQRMTDATGTATLITGTGDITLEERAERSYLVNYTTNITENTTIDEQTIEPRTPESTLYNSWGQLQLDEFILLKRPADPSQRSQNWNIGSIPVYNENMPTSFNPNFTKAYNDTQTRTNGKFSYNIVSRDSTVGITNKWVPNNQVPFGFISYTTIDDYFPDGSIKHVTTLYSNDVGILDTAFYAHELGWALRLNAVSQDDIFVMYNGGTGGSAHLFCNDEIRIIMDNQSLKQYTDFGKFQNVAIDTVVNNAPSTFDLVSPTIADTNQRYSKPVTFVWNKTSDPDSDNVTYALNISGAGKDTTISNLADTTSTMPASFFTQDSTYNWTVSATDGELKTSTRPRAFTIREANSADENDPIARIFQLYPNYPNPFNPSTTIKFEMPRASLVNLTVYDILGRQVSVLVNERRDAGVHEVKFDGSNLASGVYFYRLQAGSFVETRKVLLLR